MFDCIGHLYNPHRRYSTVDYLTPDIALAARQDVTSASDGIVIVDLAWKRCEIVTNLWTICREIAGTGVGSATGERTACLDLDGCQSHRRRNALIPPKMMIATKIGRPMNRLIHDVMASSVSPMPDHTSITTRMYPSPAAVFTPLIAR